MTHSALNAPHSRRGITPAVVVLWALVLLSALAVIASTHHTRQRVDRLETLRREAAELQVVWGQYMLEQSTWAAYGRVEQIARDELDMRLPDDDDIVMVIHE
ncbi:cell division protein FtsL [Marinimicrobium sp. C6131]|uniref:cell division protein FtsL n=1 Tax=Marinimicrobium sp. C6131 TaxID=3022676 RepID=UPI00223E722A|nr:cell division protein FtsL [Marinimicrobium sp. C6131]UZJ46086.1 cell division protein FtsL [Marinimicrobium sp. C6131]